MAPLVIYQVSHTFSFEKTCKRGVYLQGQAYLDLTHIGRYSLIIAVYKKAKQQYHKSKGKELKHGPAGAGT
jgi:hypothetical protein